MSQNLAQTLEKKSESDFAFVVRVTCLTILLTLGMEWRSFFPGFRHPFLNPVPLFEPLAKLPASIDIGIFILCISMLFWLFLIPQKRLPALIISICIAFWSIQDIVRFQPWFHMYLFVTLVAAFSKESKKSLDALRIMVCGVYFWAGFHKLNLTFFTQIMPWFVSPLYTPSFDWLFKIAAFVTPFFEASIGILLIFPQWRRVATVMAFSMLTLVLICLGPYGHNWKMVIPLWNVWLFLMELRLFLNFSFKESLLKLKLQRLNSLSLAMFVIAPALAIFIPWYARLGFKIFSGNTLTAEIILDPEERLSREPKLFRGMLKQNRRLNFKIPIYHSAYAFQMRARAISHYLDHPSKAKIRIYSPPPFYSTDKEYKEIDLL